MAVHQSFGGMETTLQSTDTKNLLDVIDKLRSQGISRYVDLPEIVVCGEQSSGKSSVLEAISGVPFPSKDNLCTRFATELILRRSREQSIKVRIVPGTMEDRSVADTEELLKFTTEVSATNPQLDAVIESAKKAMGIDDSSKTFSSDILRLEISGPEQPHLTLVDLPGLFQAGSRQQSDADSEVVKSLVLSYMKSSRSIILAVVSAKNDFNNQSITRFAREIDPKGTRTLGLITKPDTLDEGSDSERFYTELAQNKEVHFRLGWHVLRNRDYASRECTLQERHRMEEEFFSSGVWKSLPPAHLGVHSLKPRLSKILKEQVIAQLPQVITQIRAGIQDCEVRLNALGAPRATVKEQRRHLLHVSQSYTKLIGAATDGTYLDPFFGDALTEKGYQRRLRAVLQNTLADFAKAMHQKGRTYTIVEDRSAKPGEITRTEYISKVNKLLQRSRGRELPGAFDPLIVGQLFREQREPWAGLVREYQTQLIDAAHRLVHDALSSFTDHSTYERLMKRLINPRLKSLTAQLQEKVNEILSPHDAGHPITYNHYLTDNVQKAQNERSTREMRKILTSTFGADPTEEKTMTVNTTALVKVLVTKTEANMNNYASSTATDFMEAYYKVAMKQIIDDFAVLAIEACLVEKLPMLLSPEDILDMDDDDVTAFAAEDEDVSAERSRCDEKLQVLENGLSELRDVPEYPSVGFADLEICSTDSEPSVGGSHKVVVSEPLSTSSAVPKPTSIKEGQNQGLHVKTERSKPPLSENAVSKGEPSPAEANQDLDSVATRRIASIHAKMEVRKKARLEEEKARVPVVNT